MILSKRRSGNSGENPFVWKREKSAQNSVSDGYRDIWSTEVSDEDEPRQ